MATSQVKRALSTPTKPDVKKRDTRDTPRKDSGKRCQQKQGELSKLLQRHFVYADKKSLSRTEIEDVLIEDVQKVILQRNWQAICKMSSLNNFEYCIWYVFSPYSFEIFVIYITSVNLC